MNKKRVLLFGGLFDPVHIGHLLVAGMLLDLFGNWDEVWFLPSPSSKAFSRSLTEKAPASIYSRINMLSIAVKAAEVVGMKICTHGIDELNEICEYSRIKGLIKKFPHCEFSYLVGTDQANTIRKWKNSRHFLRLIPFVVVSRVYFGNSKPPEWALSEPHLFLDLKGAIPYTSSSAIRAMIGRNEKPVYNGMALLPDLVLRYIHRNKLYGYTSED